jgi:hypothetical protein
LHVLPRGFVRIRHSGFLANRSRSRLVALSRQLLDDAAIPRSSTLLNPASGTWSCPKCAAPMTVIERLTPGEIRLRAVRRDTYGDIS